MEAETSSASASEEGVSTVVIPDEEDDIPIPQKVDNESAPIDTENEEMEFDPNSLIYMANACCELLHYRSAAVVVAILEIALMLVWLGVCVLFYHSVGLSLVGKVAVSGQAIVAAIMFGAIGLTFAGVKLEKPSFLWPHMVIQIIGICIGIILTVIAVISMAAGTHIAEAVFGVLLGRENLPRVEQALGPIWPFCLAVIFDFCAAIGIWFYILIRGCYDYLLDKNFFDSADAKAIQLQCKQTQHKDNIKETVIETKA